MSVVAPDRFFIMGKFSGMSIVPDRSSLARFSGMPTVPDRFHHWQVQCDSSGQISSLARFSGMPIFPDRFSSLARLSNITLTSLVVFR